MSRFVEIRNDTCIEDIIKAVKHNPAGGIFRCVNSNSRNALLTKIESGKFEWLSKNSIPLLFNPRNILSFEPINKCDVLVKHKDKPNA